MFSEFITQYGPSIIYTILTAIAGYIGIVLKNVCKRYLDEKTKKIVVDTVVKGVEQIHQDLKGNEKLDIAIDNAIEMLAIKGITVTELELRMLIEASVNEFNNNLSKEAVENA